MARPALTPQASARLGAFNPGSEAEPPALVPEVPTVLGKLQKWADYAAVGAPVWPTRFIPMKTPMSREILDNWSLPDAPKHPLTVRRRVLRAAVCRHRCAAVCRNCQGGGCLAAAALVLNTYGAAVDDRRCCRCPAAAAAAAAAVADLPRRPVLPPVPPLRRCRCCWRARRRRGAAWASSSTSPITTACERCYSTLAQLPAAFSMFAWVRPGHPCLPVSSLDACQPSKQRRSQLLPPLLPPPPPPLLPLLRRSPLPVSAATTHGCTRARRAVALTPLPAHAPGTLHTRLQVLG